MMTEANIEEELLRRELARRHLEDFAEYCYNGYIAGPAHKLICTELDLAVERVQAGLDQRLIFTCPPGLGKSLLISRLFPAFVLGSHPDWRLMLTSYGADLAQEHSREARNLLRSDEYANLFGRRATWEEDENGVPEPAVELAEDSQSVKTWNIARPYRGGLSATGVGGALTGRRFRVGIVDDPIKDFSWAETDKRLTDQIKWLQTTFYTRREVIGATLIVIVMTRWAVGDLVGYVKEKAAKDPAADQYREIRIPALSETEKEAEGETPDALGRTEPGKSYWPGIVTEQQLETTRANSTEMIWAGMYGQRPRVAEGNLIKRGWFRFLDAPPAHDVEWVRSWDLAQTKKEVGKADPDWTVGSKVGRWRHKDGDQTELRTVIADQQACQETPANVKKLIKDTARADGYGVPIIVEVVATWEAFFQELLDDEELWGYTLLKDKPHTDKVVRSAGFRTRAENGRIYLVGTLLTPWIVAFLNEAALFPNGPHDDRVDSPVSGYNHFLPSDEEFTGSAPAVIRGASGWNKGPSRTTGRR